MVYFQFFIKRPFFNIAFKGRTFFLNVLYSPLKDADLSFLPPSTTDYYALSSTFYVFGIEISKKSVKSSLFFLKKFKFCFAKKMKKILKRFLNEFVCELGFFSTISCPSRSVQMWTNYRVKNCLGVLLTCKKLAICPFFLLIPSPFKAEA
jgi:hypothetical protein